MTPAAAARYLVPARTHRVEESVRRSRFVTTANEVESFRAALADLTQGRARAEET